MAAKEVVGFAGLGNMGLAMARNLQEFLEKEQSSGSYSPSFHVWNRTQSKAQPLLDHGASLAPSISGDSIASFACTRFENIIADLAKECTIVFAMLYDDAALEQAVECLLAAGPPKGAIFVNCATVYPGCTEALAQKAEAAGVIYLSAPIFGRPDAIKLHKGLCISAGPEEGRQRVKPLLDAIGQGILDVGDEARSGSAMKLVGNFFISSIIEVIAEGMTLAEKNGLQRQNVVQFVETLFPGHIFKGYVNGVANDNFVPTKEDPGFALIGGMKDVGHMQRLGTESGAPLPIADIIMQHFEQVKEMGGGNLDWSGLALAVRKQAGLSVAPLQ